MNDKLQQRLSELTTELECGQRMMAELESRQSKLRESMLRISGAIQVLRELAAAAGSPPAFAPEHDESPIRA